MAVPFSSEPVARRSVVEIRGLTLGRHGDATAVLERVDLDIAAGECVLLEGATGSGKSTLLRAIAGLHIAGLHNVERRAGTIQTSSAVVLLLQHVETQLLCPTVSEEVGLGLRRLGLSTVARHNRIEAALDCMNLTGLEACEVDRLSAGQKQRVVLAALLALEPEILLLDEPFSALDAPSRHALADVIARLKDTGTTLLIAEHAPRELMSLVDRVVRMEQRTLRDIPMSATSPLEPLREDRPVPCSTREDISLDSLRPGERVLLYGLNGSGKSSRLQSLARERPDNTSVALVIQEPRRSLFARTVEDELAFSLGRNGVERREHRVRISSLLARFGLEAFAKRSPRRLSFGQQHRLAIAAALAARPNFVLLDEPFAGLDTDSRRELMRILGEEQSEANLIYVIASHDADPFEDWVHHVHHVVAAEDAPC